MYLFARSRTAASDRMAEAAAFAVDIAAKATSVTGVELSAWQIEYGAPSTAFAWTATVGSHADVGIARDKLVADVGYIDAIQGAAGLFEGPPEDVIAEIVALGGDGGHRGDFSSIVMAQCATGKIGQAMAWGVEMMNHVVAVTGRDSLFTRSMYGPWASVAWISLAASLDDIEAGTAALSADPDYLAKVDAGGDLFMPGSGHSRLSRRIG